MRRILIPLLAGALLAACGAPAAQTPRPTTAPTAEPEPARPTPPPLSEPTAAPTAAPAAEPTAPPAADKLPDLDSELWRELGRGHFSDTGVESRVLYLPAEVPADADFAANYAPGQLAVAEAVVMAQTYEGSPLIQLKADRSGVVADVPLWGAPEEAPPAAYMVALDPGSSFLLSLLPLDAAGGRLGPAIPLNWSAADGAMRIAPAPAEGQGALSDAPAEPPSADEYAAIGQAVLAELAADGLDRPAVVGATARAGEYAAAVAGVFMEERPRQLVLRRSTGDAWEVLIDSAELTPGALAAAGAPASLAAAHELRGLHQAAISQLQDPRGEGVAGHLQVERLDQGYARVTFVPAERMARDPFTMFFGPGEGGWAFLTGGTAFMGPELDQLGVPPSVR